MLIDLKIDEEARAGPRTKSSPCRGWTAGVMGLAGRADHARPRHCIPARSRASIVIHES